MKYVRVRQIFTDKKDGREIMPMVDALAVWAEERRVFKRENDDESLNRRYQSLVSEWGNPCWWKSADLREETRGWKLEKFFLLASAF